MNTKGFTLIELMIAIAIIGILLSLAIPAYQDYTVRAKISEAINVASSLKVMISEYYITMAKFPESAEQAGIDTGFSTQYISGLSYHKDDGENHARVKLTFSENTGAEVANKAIVMTATQNAGTLRWTCSNDKEDDAPIDEKYLPSNCR